MDLKPKVAGPCLYERSNWLQRSLSSWIFTLLTSLKYINTNDHKKSSESLFDLPKNPSDDDATRLLEQFELNHKISEYEKPKYWMHIKILKQNRFLLALIKTFRNEAIVPFLLFFVQDCIIKSVQPILIGWIIRTFSKKQTIFDTFWITIGLCFSSLSLIIFHHPSLLFAFRLSMRVKIVWSTLIYNKCLQLSSESTYYRNLSAVLNLLSNQTRRFDEFFLLYNHLIIVPIQTIFILIISYYYIGPTCLATFLIFIGLTLLNSFLSRKFSQLRNRSIRFTEKRLKLLDEIFRNLRAIKIYSLENFFLRRIFLYRRLEINKLQIPLMARSIMLSFSLISSRLIMYVTFLLALFLFGLDHERFSIETLLVSIALFEKLRYSLIWMLPQAISGLSDIIHSCNQMEQFLNEPSLDKKIQTYIKNKEKIILVNGMNLSNNESNFSFKVESGQILMIIGPIGSGKTTLLLSLLSEIPIQKLDSFQINGSIAYASQEAYCFNSSIRDNIIFGKEFDQNRFKKVLELTSLDYDLRQLPLGDQTIVDERGSNLSGGQKSRIGLARALYSDADIYLLDDPFSSVDPHLAKRIYEKCIREYLKDKIVILTTHHIQYVNPNDYILLLNHNRQSDSQFLNKPVKKLAENNIEKKKFDPTDFKKFEPVLNEFETKNMNYMEQKLPNESNVWNDNWKYLKRGSFGFGSIHLVIFSFIGTQTLLYFCDHWLSQWQIIQTKNSISYFILIYSMIIIFGIIFTLLRSFTFYKLCHNTSEMFHNQIIENILKASIFDHIPIGNLLNYFSRDIGVLDETLPATLFELSLATLQVLSIMLLVLSINPYIAIVTVAYILSLLILFKYYIQSFQMIRKFELQTRNSVFSHLSSTLNGLTTIRAYKVKKNFRNRFHIFTNDHTAIIFLQNASSRFFCLLVDLFSLVYITFILIIFQVFSSNVDDKLAGLCLSSMFNLIGLAQWACKRAIDSDLWINSFRNLSIFCHHHQEDEDKEEKKEVDFKSQSINILKYKDPVIEIKNLSVYYPPTFNFVQKSYILKNINIRIENGQKIGICGRSGAGKSTLINAILRLASYEGQILIEGENTRNIPLKELHRKISIIPQYPIIFEGTIRENLNLLGHHSDKELWQVLEKVELRTLVESFELNLDEHLDSILMSTGQKQLLCLARIMLQHFGENNRPLVILDEATAHVDFQTDQLIRKTINQQFNDCTVIIIAHRINTIQDCDRILVFDNGHLVEDGSPECLLANKSSHFYQLVKY